jgi:hypothetical protein
MLVLRVNLEIVSFNLMAPLVGVGQVSTYRQNLS